MIAVTDNRELKHANANTSFAVLLPVVLFGFRVATDGSALFAGVGAASWAA
jgi:hypothetical protein